MAHAWKACGRKPSRVRVPLPPPNTSNLTSSEIHLIIIWLFTYLVGEIAMSGFSNKRTPLEQALFEATFRYLRAEVRHPFSLVGKKMSFTFNLDDEEVAVYGTISSVTFAHGILTFFLSVPNVNGYLIHYFFAREGSWFVSLSHESESSQTLNYECVVDTMVG